jgi:hypothetical protein
MIPDPVLSVSPRLCVRRSLSAWAAVLLSLATLVTPARAQIGIEDVLGSVTDIDVSASCWATKSPSLRGTDCPGGRNGYGLEVLWELKTVHLGRAPRVDTTWVASQKTVTVRQGRADTVTTLTMKEEEEETLGYRLLFELALGYSQFSGFRSADERYDLRGTVREQPSLAIYGSVEGPGVLAHFSPYLGVRSGLIRLSDVQLFTPADGDETTAYTGHAEVFQVGGALGIAAEAGPVSLFVEGQLNLRRFPSIDWTAGAGGPIPGFLPRGLDFSGPSLSVGLQIHIREPAENN